MNKLTIILSVIVAVTLVAIGMLFITVFKNPEPNAGPFSISGTSEITWDDLIPEGVPYADIIGLGEQDNERDIWKPDYDQNAIQLNNDLEGKIIKLPGYVVPLDTRADGTKSFLLVPYAGACIHTPPPPANQIIVVETAQAWESESLYEPVWVTGTLTTNLHETELAFVGYEMNALFIEKYDIEIPPFE